MQLASALKILALCVVALLLSSCMALFELLGALSALSSHTPMPMVRAELGQPEWSGRDHQGFQVDRFQLAEGSSTTGTRIKVTVTYDRQQRVKAVKAQDENGREIPLERLAVISK